MIEAIKWSRKHFIRKTGTSLAERAAPGSVRTKSLFMLYILRRFVKSVWISWGVGGREVQSVSCQLNFGPLVNC